MRRLLYITLFAVVTVYALVAQSPDDAPDMQGELIVEVDTLVSADTTVNTPTRPNRNRRVTAVNNAATRTQNVNDPTGDSLRIIERRRQRSTQFENPDGTIVMVDTVTGQEWIDSTMLPKPPKMLQPLMFAVEVGVNVWDPVMRIFGQKYGGVDFSAGLNLHNRYIPTFEAGFGMANKTPSDMNFTYKSPLAPYFKLGADYNFIYNSDPDYRFIAGLRYGFSAFRYSVENVTFDDSYWGEDVSIAFPSQSVTAGWFELVLGLRVKIVGPISAGWMLRYHSILHQSHPSTGDAWYIPGYGTSGSMITGSFSIVYNLQLKPRKAEDYEPAKDVDD